MTNFVLTLNYRADCEDGMEVLGVYKNIEGAKKALREAVEKERANDAILDREDELTDESTSWGTYDDCDGRYTEITIVEKTVE